MDQEQHRPIDILTRLLSSLVPPPLTAAANTTTTLVSGHASSIWAKPLLTQMWSWVCSVTAADVFFLFNLLLKVIHPLDVIGLVFAGWATVPLFRCLYQQLPQWKSSSSSYSNNNSAFIITAFEQSYLFQLADHISQVARLAIVVYAADCLLNILVGLGFNFHHLENLSWGFAKIIYIAWAAQRLAVLKRYLLGVVVAARSPKQLGQASVVDRLLDGIIFLCTVMFLLDILDMEMGVGVPTSMFAFGSAGTLMVGLASRDLAAMLVNGLALSTTNRFNQGEHVKFGDGTIGLVHKIGWMETIIRNYDNLLEVVPNNELGMQRVRNLSRCTVCQIKQTLRFDYDDAEKLPKCLSDMMDEIKASCKDVISDGSKPVSCGECRARHVSCRYKIFSHTRQFYCFSFEQLGEITEPHI